MDCDKNKTWCGFSNNCKHKKDCKDAMTDKLSKYIKDHDIKLNYYLSAPICFERLK